MTTPVSPLPDAQDPLPENNWFWRRLFIYASFTATMWLIWTVVERLATTALLAPPIGIPSLETIGKWLIGLAWSIMTFYMVAPSAEHIVKVFQTVGLFKAGVATKAEKTTSEPGKTETTSATTGPATPPAGDPAPPQPPAITPKPGGATEIME